MSEREQITEYERKILNGIAEKLRAESQDLYRQVGMHDAHIAVGEAACLIEQWCIGDENLIGYPSDATDDVR